MTQNYDEALSQLELLAQELRSLKNVIRHNDLEQVEETTALRARISELERKVAFLEKGK